MVLLDSLGLTVLSVVFFELPVYFIVSLACDKGNTKVFHRDPHIK